MKQPARRSVLFVYHGAEERGLFGSRYYVAHPVILLAQTVAVLNGDMIAEACVPALEYSSNLHPDYHTPRDNPDQINYPKLTRITQWMYLTGWFVANADKRPALEPMYDVRR